MATHYIENESNANQYYFNANSNAASQVQRPAQDASYASPVTVSTTVGPSEYSPYPVGVSGVRSQPQQIRSDRNVQGDNDPYQLPQQHQSVAGFSKNVPQQQHPLSSSPVPQVKATVRAVNSQERQQGSPVQYQQQQAPPPPQQQQQQQPSQQRQQQVYGNFEPQSSSQSSQALPPHQQYQYDPRQQVGQPSGVSGYYQAPNSPQYVRHEADQRGESTSQGHDPHAQVIVNLILFFKQKSQL